MDSPSSGPGTDIASFEHGDLEASLASQSTVCEGRACDPGAKDDDVYMLREWSRFIRGYLSARNCPKRQSGVVDRDAGASFYPFLKDLVRLAEMDGGIEEESGFGDEAAHRGLEVKYL